MPERCDWCGGEVQGSQFLVETGFSGGRILVGECCGDISTRLIKKEYAGPLLTKKDHTECCGRRVDAPYDDSSS
jgi:hypothetical protein